MRPRAAALRQGAARVAGRFASGLGPVAWVLGLAIPIGLALDHALGGFEVIRFATPWALLVGLGAVLTLMVEGYLDWRRSGRIAHSHGALLSGLKPGLWVRLRFLPMQLRTVSIMLLAVALARPQDTSRRQDADVEGVDIVVAIDMSGSMEAEDMQGTRLEAAKSTILDFIGRRVSDRVGIVVFGRDAYTLCPLTLDYSVLQGMVSRLELGQVDGQQTAIGNAVGTAINRLRNSTARSKVVILVTDGESNAGNISPQQAAQFAQTLGIRIYTILIGTTDEAPVSVGTDFFGMPITRMQRSPINPELLQEMASMTGGEFARATSRGELRSQVARIDRLERSRLQDTTAQYLELFHVPLLLGLLLLGVDLVLRATRLRRFP
jgi:Ca-activated chloride channel homolog